MLKANFKSVAECKSIITIICEEASLPKLTNPSHDYAIQYLGLSASLRDREQLSRIICKSYPDILTQTIREGVNAYDPIIRKVHQSVDLSATCQDLEDFLRDFFSLFDKDTTNNTTKPEPPTKSDAKPSEKLNGAKHTSKLASRAYQGPAVSVEDIANVLRKHQNSLHKFLHQMAKNGGDVTAQYRTYVKTAASHFRVAKAFGSSKTSTSGIPSPELTSALSSLVSSLPAPKRTKILETADSYSAYLSALSSVSSDRLHATLSGEKPPAGPGAYLARWTSLMELEPSTPLVPEGKPRYGVARVLTEGEWEDVDVAEEAVQGRWKWPEMPGDVDEVVEALGVEFGKILGAMGMSIWGSGGDEEDVD
jgi:hypothetical protein